MINWYENIPFFSIFLAMFAGFVSALIKDGKKSEKICLAFVLIILAMSIALLYYTVKFDVYFTFKMGHYEAPWGNELRAGSLEALLSVVISLLMFLTLLGGRDYIFLDILKEKQHFYYLIVNLIFGSMLAMIYTNDVFTAYVFMEIAALASCGLIMFKDRGDAMLSTIHYLIVSSIGSGLFLLGISMLYDITGHLLMPNIKEQVTILFATGEYNEPFSVVVALVLIGLSIKSGLFPFHSMLPGAYNASTPASSGILSGLMLKSYIILIIKFIYEVFSIEVVRQMPIIDIFFVFGIIGMIYGSVIALKEENIKRMLAYSSVAQIGYIYMGIGLGNNIGMIAAAFHIISHAATKTMLFVSSAGLMESSDNLDENFFLCGAGIRNKLAGVTYTVGTLSMIGIPLFSGFVSKLYLAEASLLDNSFKMAIALLALALSMVLNAMYFMPSIISIWRSKNNIINYGEKHRNKPAFIVACISFITINFYLGINYESVLKIIEHGINLINY